MREFLKGLGTFVGSAAWWVTQQFYGENISKWLKSVFPTGSPNASLAEITRWAIEWVPLLGLLFLGSFFFYRWRKALRAPQGPPEWPLDRLIDYLVHRSKWGYSSLARLNFSEMVRDRAEAEFRRAARSGEIGVKGRLPNTLYSSEIDNNYWRYARLSRDLLGTDLLGSPHIVPPLQCFSDLTVQREAIKLTWPESQLLHRMAVRIYLWTKFRWFEILSLRVWQKMAANLVLVGLMVATLGILIAGFSLVLRPAYQNNDTQRGAKIIEQQAEIDKLKSELVARSSQEASGNRRRPRELQLAHRVCL